jgi:hypothetical protein
MPMTRHPGEGVFDQSAIHAMVAAFEACCRSLRLEDRADPMTEIVARQVIEVAGTGESDPQRICGLVLLALSEDRRTVEIQGSLLDLGTILEHLAFAVRHITEGERIIARQHEIIASLERTGIDTSEARTVLRQFEELRGMLLADCDRLRKDLAASSMTSFAERNARQAREARVEK